MVVDVVADRTLLKALASNADEIGDRHMLEYVGGVVTYAQMHDYARRLASFLIGRGVGPGDRVALCIEHSPEYFAAWFAVTLAGACVVPVSTLHSRDEMLYQLDHSRSVAAVVDVGKVDLFGSLTAECAAMRFVVAVNVGQMTDGTADGNRAMSAEPIAESLPEVHPDDYAMIMYTSGTTARPKGVILSHGNVFLFSLNWSAAYRYSRVDRLLHFFPLYHSNGGVGLFGPPLLVGATTVLRPRFSASMFSRECRDNGITITALNATHVKFLLDTPENDADHTHSCYRAHFALELDEERRQQFEVRFGIRLVELYGLTEAGIVTCAPVDALWAPNSGPPLPGVEVSIRDDNDTEVSVGEVGEIVIRHQSRFGLWNGYLDDEQAMPRVVREGWLYTGDMGSVDDTGYLHFAQRKNDMIKRAGFNVAPAEVERALMSHDSVVEAAVVGIPDPIKEEAIIAFVVVADETSPKQLEKHCESMLAAYKVPQRIVALERIPETFIGKTDKRRLREMAMGPL